jgi:hypothetical protein
MMWPMKRTRLALVLIGLLALAGGGTAIAAKGRGGGPRPVFAVGGAFRAAHGPGDDFQAAASYLGLTTADLLGKLRGGQTLAQVAGATSGKSAQGLIDALVAHETSELADAVKAGKLTQAQADMISAGLTQRFTDLVNGTRPPFAPGPGFGHHGPGDIGAAATYLGTTPAALLQQLMGGKTLAEIANATSGKSAQGLIDALVAQEKSELADAVKAGRLTQAQADTIAAGLTQRVTDLVNGTFPMRGDRPHRGFFFPHPRGARI